MQVWPLKLLKVRRNFQNAWAEAFGHLDFEAVLEGEETGGAGKDV
jgi:hypothetical protein